MSDQHEDLRHRIYLLSVGLLDLAGIDSLKTELDELCGDASDENAVIAFEGGPIKCGDLRKAIATGYDAVARKLFNALDSRDISFDLDSAHRDLKNMIAYGKTSFDRQPFTPQMIADRVKASERHRLIALGAHLLYYPDDERVSKWSALFSSLLEREELDVQDLGFSVESTHFLRAQLQQP